MGLDYIVRGDEKNRAVLFFCVYQEEEGVVGYIIIWVRF